MATPFRSEADFHRFWRDVPDVSSVSFQDSIDDIQKNSFVCKSLRAEFEAENTFSKKGLQPLITGEIQLERTQKLPLDMQVPGFSLKSHIPFPSSFTHAVMVDLFSIALLMSQGKELSNELKKCLADHSKALQSEQANYQRFAETQWTHYASQKHSEITPQVLNYVNRIWKLKLERIYDYPKYYTNASCIPLIDSDAKIDDKSQLAKLKKAGHIGRRLMKYFFPPLRTYLVKAQDVFEKMKSELDSLSEDPTSRKLGWPRYKLPFPNLVSVNYHPEVGRDKKAEKLAYETNAQIVLSSSAFCALMNHSGHESAWDIPVVVREVEEESGKKKIIFFDQKLPPRTMTVADRQKYFLKKAVKKLLTKVPAETRAKSAKFYDHVDLETFGIDDQPKAQKTASCHCNKPKDDLSETCSESEMTIDIQEGKCRKEPKCNCKKVDSTFAIDYSLWELKSSNEESVLSKKPKLKDLKLLVRTTHEGRGSYAYQKIGPFKLSVKPEYQPEYGAETVSLSEVIKDWSSLIIRPTTTLGRVRIDPISGEMIQLEKKSLTDVTIECRRLFQINPYDRIRVVHIILDKISELSPGSYMVNHEVESPGFVTVYKASEQRHSFNLTLKYGSINVEDIAYPKSPWLPLDTTVITPTFHYFKRAPCCFAPSKYAKNKKSTPTKFPRPNGKPKKKRKHPDKKKSPKKQSDDKSNSSQPFDHMEL